MSEQIIKYYYPIYVIFFICIVFILPSVRTYRKTGINPVTFSSKDTAHDYSGFMMKLCTLLLVIMVFIFSFSEKAYLYFVPISYLEITAVSIFGFVIIHLALLWIIIAQIHMGVSWRIGIDETNKTDLITSGLFSLSRNPIFLGILVNILGLFLVLPNALSFALLIAIYIVVQVQVRLEEEFLKRTNESRYSHYYSNVRRWI